MFEQTIKNFAINFNAANERGTVCSGQTVTGHVSFQLTKVTKVGQISMRLLGQVSVHWSTGGGKNRSRRHFRAEINYFDLKNALLATREPVKLQPGTHVYPFTCQIPQGDFPSTFKGVHGETKYQIIVSISRPWHMSKDFVTDLNYVGRFDYSQPHLWAPMAGTNLSTLCCLWCASGPITMTTSTEKKAFTPGETVKVFCKFSNGSSRKAIPKVKLIQKQVFYTAQRVSKRPFDKCLASVIGSPIHGDTSVVHSEMMVVIPPTTAFTISNCDILTLDYVVEVTLSMRAAHDLTVQFPIIICDAPVNPQPPSY